jgi:hypothetical protein
MDIVEILKQDYQRFPAEQTYSVYDAEVYFADPLNQFRGVDRFRDNINFIATWFRDVRMDLHEIRRDGNVIITRWTLNWTAPVPWRPRIRIPGWSELTLNERDRIISHIDYWNCSRWQVLRQHLSLFG